jgi:hypothetical protein
MFQSKRESEAKSRQVNYAKNGALGRGNPRHMMHSILLQIASCDVSYKKYEITVPLTPNCRKTSFVPFTQGQGMWQATSTQLLLLLDSSRGVPLKGSIGNLETTQSADSNIQDHNADERGQETHEDTCEQLETSRSLMTSGVQTRSEVLVLVEQGLTTIRLGAGRRLGGVVALKFHVDCLLV